MSVSFAEPDLAKLREQHSLNSESTSAPFAESAISDSEDDKDDKDDEDDKDDTLRPSSSQASHKLDVENARALLSPANSAKHSVNYTTQSNTNSNSMSFRRLSSVSSGSDIYEATSDGDTNRPKFGGRKLSANSTVSSQSDGVISPLNNRALSGTTKSLTDSPFQKRISFDTISQTTPVSQPSFKFSRPSFSSASPRVTNLEDSFSSFSVSSKHVLHKTSYWSRSFLCSMSSVNNSRRALQWLVENVMENGDELICLKVDHDISNEPAHYQHQAEDLLAEVVSIVDSNLQIKIVVEVALGSIKTVVRKTMLLYQPALVVVGTTAKTYSNVMRYMTRKTLSNYLLNHSPVPVIVILPDLIEKHKARSHQGSTVASSVSDGAPASPLTLASSPVIEASKTTSNSDVDYLTSLINRPMLETDIDDDVQPIFNYKSLFQREATNTSTDTEALSPESSLPSTKKLPSIMISPDPLDDSNVNNDSNNNLSSTKSPTLSVDEGMFQKQKRPSWSARFFPKGLRRLSATTTSVPQNHNGLGPTKSMETGRSLSPSR